MEKQKAWAAAQYDDDVNGIIIGGEYTRCELLSGRGEKIATAWIDRDTDPMEWARRVRKEIMEAPTGSGKPLKFYPDIIAEIYGYDSWELKIYNS